MERTYDWTIGGLRGSAVKAKDEGSPIGLAYVSAMALIQIAQEMNEIKNILAAAKLGQE